MKTLPNQIPALLDFPVPKNVLVASLRRVIGMFAHFSKWIPNFSEKLRPLVDCKHFPMDNTAENAFENIKKLIASSALHSIDETLEFVVETDGSEHALAGTLSQCGRPVAFYSRTLSFTEQKHSAIEREAYAIVECLRKWKHFLIGKRFKLIG